MAKDEEPPKLRIVDDTSPVTRLEAQEKKNNITRRRIVEIPKSVSRPFNEAVQPIDEILPQQESPSSKIPVGFFVCLIVLFGALFFAGAILVYQGGSATSEKSSQKAAVTREETQQELATARTSIRTLQNAIQSFAGATTPSELIPAIRHPKRVSPLIENYYKTHPFPAAKKLKLINHFPISLKTTTFVVATALEEETQEKHIFLCEYTSPSNIRIDWETHVCYQPTPIEQFITEQPKQSTPMRVFAQPDNYYVYQFQDESRYQCLKITFRDSSRFLWAYIERTHPDYIKFQKIYSRSNKREPFLLSLRYPENVKDDLCVHIDELMNKRWPFVEDPSVNAQKNSEN